MKKLFVKFLLVTTTLFNFSCSPEDGKDGVDGIDGFDNGLGYIVFYGDITESEVSRIIEENIGNNTHTILINNTTNLTNLVLPEIPTLIRLEVTGNERLESLSIPNLEAVYENINIRENEALRTLELENLGIIRSLTIDDNLALTTLNVQNLNEAGNFNLRDNPLLENLNLSNLQKIVGLSLQRLESLSQLNLNNLASIESLQLVNLNLESIDIGNLNSITSQLSIRNNNSLKNVDIPNISNPENDLLNIDIEENSELEVIDLGLVSSVNRLEITDNEKLTTVSMNALENTSSNLVILNNPELSALSFPELLNSTYLNIQQNQSLLSIEFPKLETVSNTFIISSNENLGSISIPFLAHIGSRFSISNNAKLSSLAFPELTTIGNEEAASNSFGISGNNELTSISFPKLISTTTISTVRINGDVLDNFNFESLTSFNTLDIDSQAQITSVVLSSAIESGNLYLDSFGRLSTPAIDQVIDALHNSLPNLINSNIRINGVASENALIKVEAIVANGNSVRITE